MLYIASLLILYLITLLSLLLLAYKTNMHPFLIIPMFIAGNIIFDKVEKLLNLIGHYLRKKF